jgi:dihydrofolate reductase
MLAFAGTKKFYIKRTALPGEVFMSRVRYGVAMSLDGFIAGPNGEADWITIEPEFDFAALWAQFDTGIMGRRTWEAATRRLGGAAFQGMKVFVASRTLQAANAPTATILPEVTREQIARVRAQSKKDIWLFGGGELFRQLLELGEVDTVEVSVIPVLLGEGVPLLPPCHRQTRLLLSAHRVYPTGRVALTYDVLR